MTLTIPHLRPLKNGTTRSHGPSRLTSAAFFSGGTKGSFNFNITTWRRGEAIPEAAAEGKNESSQGKGVDSKGRKHF